MESHYTINVSLNGRHFFATAPHSLPITDTDKAHALLATMREKFPAAEGYAIDMVRWECQGSFCG